MLLIDGRDIGPTEYHAERSSSPALSYACTKHIALHPKLECCGLRRTWRSAGLDLVTPGLRGQTTGKADSITTPVDRSMHRTCILGFHRLVDVRRADHDVTWGAWRHLVRELRELPIHLSADLAEEPERSTVILTFDDATADHFEAGRILHEQEISGVFFVPPGRLGMPGYLQREHVQELAAMGHAVGAHGFNHVALDSIDRSQLRHEVLDAKKLLEDLTEHAVEWFAPPGGISAPGLRDELQDAGYRASRSMIWGIKMFGADRWALPCVPATAFTLQVGWVRHAVRFLKLHPTMKIAWTLKQRMPKSAALRARTILHSVGRRARR